jgi:hypothetical protein
MVLIQRANKQLQIPEEWLEQYEREGYHKVEIPAPKVNNGKSKKRIVVVDENTTEE